MKTKLIFLSIFALLFILVSYFYLETTNSNSIETEIKKEVSVEESEEPKPKILFINPTSTVAGSVVEIHGVNLGGFEGDMIATFERSDGKVVNLDSLLPHTSTTTVIKVKVAPPCKEGETVYAPYSGRPSKCDYFEFTPGTYKVYTSPWGKKSNVLPFEIVSK